MTELFEPLDEMACHLFRGQAIMLMRAEVTVVGAVAKYVVGHAEQGVRDGDNGPLLSTRRHQPPILAAGIGITFANGAPGGLDQRPAQPGIGLADVPWVWRPADA